MSNIMDTLSPLGKPLSDEELMNLLIKVRRGELSPEEAERLLSGLPGLGADTGAGISGPAEQTAERSESIRQSQGHVASAPLGQARRGT